MRLFGTKKAEGKKLGGARLDLPKIRKNPLIEIIAINTGYVGVIKVPHILKYDTIRDKNCLLQINKND